MKKKIIKTKKLNRRQLRALSALINNCNHNDGTHYGFIFDADSYYLLYEGAVLIAAAAVFLMGELLNGRCVYEIAAFTAAEHRHRQHFSRLIASMRPKLINAYAKYAVYDNPDASAVLKALPAVHSHDELMLTLSLKSTTDTSCTVSADGVNKACIRLDAESGHAQNDYSECYYRIDNSGDNAYIFGVRTYANHLRHGHAYTLLCELFGMLRAQGVDTATLQVSSENEPALRLYHKLGMQQSEKISLYYEQF